jgi:hypothetical protein
MTLPVVFTANGPSGYNLTKSLRFRSSASAYLNRTPASASNRQTWTWSAWIKRGVFQYEGMFSCYTGSGSVDNSYLEISFNADKLQVSGYSTVYRQTTQVFRDPSAWYHIVVALDTTQATGSNRLKIYVNGTQVTAFATSNDPTQNANLGINQAALHNICNNAYFSNYYDGYMAEVNFIDGQQLTPSSFGSTNPATGVWQPAKYTGTYGTNGFYLPFTDNSSLTSSTTGNIGIGKDFSGNANYWTTNNISLASGTYSSLTSGSGTYTVPTGVTSLNYLVVAGGGGAGGNAFNGGGGAGGVLVGTMAVTGGQTISYSIGAGGAGGTAANGSNGSNTTFGTLTAIGGGAGGSSANGAGASGGSGGGGAGAGSGTGAAGAGTSGQGNNGGVGFGAGSGLWGAGGGGGAGAVGVSGSSGQGGNGGAGYTWINGTTYAGGGGGATGVGNTAGVGGSGGGGAGSNSSTGTSGTANTGGGGGGASGVFTGGSGGSGIIIVGYGATTTYDSMTDVPTLTSATTANYATLNPLMFRLSNTPAATLSNGNLTSTHTPSAYGTYVFSTIAGFGAKFYYEAVVSTLIGGVSIGIDGGLGVNSSEAARVVYQNSGGKRVNGTASAYGASYTTGDVIGVAIDLIAGSITFYKNNVSQGVASSAIGTNPYFSYGESDTGNVLNWNFGQQGFTYTPPTGFVALNTYNLPTSTIVKGNTVMDATLWTGNGSSQTIATASGFKPDLVWAKNRSSGANSWNLFDTIRGATNGLASDSTSAEFTRSGVTAFTSTGYTIGSNGDMNGNTNAIVGYNFNAGSGSSSSNTNGSITSTVSVNATAGFSIATYTGNGTAGATVGHGLGVAPSMMIIKSRSTAGTDWGVYHASLGNTVILFLNSSGAYAGPNSAYWNNTSPSSSVFTLGVASELNGNTRTFVAYCWSEIAGFSKFGSYTGNGSYDGSFVYTGFRPKYVMIKISSTTGSWYVLDTSRSPYNEALVSLNPNSSAAESTDTNFLDILSNGFKLRTNGGAVNGSGATLIYMAFAENPFKNALAR